MVATNSATPQSNTEPKSPFKSKTVILLHEWWLVKQCKGITIGGVASMDKGRERVFLSTVIAKRHEANVLETEDGITVIVRGFINAPRSCQNGFPSEVCRNFLFGFPHNWKKYSDHSFGDEDNNGVTEFGGSTACSEKRADDALRFSIDDNDLNKRQDSLLSNNNCLTPKKIFNGLGTTFGNDCKQPKPTATMDCSIVMKTKEYECKENTAGLESPQLQFGKIYHGENGSDVPVKSPAGNPEIGQPLMGIYDPNPCTVVSEKSTEKSSTSTKKMKEGSGECQENQCTRQKKYKDTDNLCRRVTRSISKRKYEIVEKDEKATVSSVSAPVRRSPRLYSRRK